MVAAYVLASLGLGGTQWARPVWYGLMLSWFAVLWLGRRWSSNISSGKFLRGLEVVGCNVALTLVLAELALRLVAAGSGVSPLVSHALDAYRLVPGHDYGGGLRGNSLGYPGPDFQPDKPPGTFRIAALGDSFAVGPAVPAAENYLHLLEQGLPDTEVYNFGVSGTGPREYLLILRTDVWNYHPDLVLVSVFVGNDITETLATPRHLDPRQHALYLLLKRSWRLGRERQRQGPDAAPSQPCGGFTLSEATFREVEGRRLEVCRVPPSAALEKKWRQALADLERLIADCRQRRVPVALVLIPDEFQVNPAVLAEAIERGDLKDADLDLEYPQKRLTQFCADHKVPCLDLLPAFTGKADTYAVRDTHWNVRGNRLAAAQLIPWLTSLKKP